MCVGVLLRGIRYFRLLVGREAFILVDQVIALIQLQHELRSDMTLTIAIVTDDLSVSDVYLPYPGGMSVHLL